MTFANFCIAFGFYHLNSLLFNYGIILDFRRKKTRFFFYEPLRYLFLSQNLYIYKSILQTSHFSILVCFVYLFLLIYPSHTKYTTSVVYLGCKPNAVLLFPFSNMKQKNRLNIGIDVNLAGLRHTHF